MYQELTGLRKPILDKSGILHWPVVLLYAEVMTSDFIEDFCETDMFLAHLDTISFSLVHSFQIDLSVPKIFATSRDCRFEISLIFQTCFQIVAHHCHGIQSTITPVKLSRYTMRSASEHL